MVSGSSPPPPPAPPAPPMPKTTHFGNNITQQSPPHKELSNGHAVTRNGGMGNGVSVNPDLDKTVPATLSASNGAVRLISQTPLNQSFESEESSNGGYGKLSPDPIISKKRYRPTHFILSFSLRTCCCKFELLWLRILSPSFISCCSSSTFY